MLLFHYMQVWDMVMYIKSSLTNNFSPITKTPKHKIYVQISLLWTEKSDNHDEAKKKVANPKFSMF
jgi:hypothetical protein